MLARGSAGLMLMYNGDSRFVMACTLLFVEPFWRRMELIAMRSLHLSKKPSLLNWLIKGQTNYLDLSSRIKHVRHNTCHDARWLVLVERCGI